MNDPSGRPVENLRISVTQRCNMRCFYCHREGESSPGSEMSPSEIERIVIVGARNGIRKVKLTGGEPLLRRDIQDIVSRIAPLVEEVSMTTNGTLLSEQARSLSRAGLSRVNVSLDTLERERFREVTGTDMLSDVQEGIARALEEGLTPLKINMVVTRKNAHEVEDMISLIRDGMVLQLIEYVAPREALGEEFRNLHFDLSAVENELGRRALRVEERRMHRRKKFFLPAEVETVRSMHNSAFCAACNRMRVTSDGRLKPCLLRQDNHIDVRPYLSGDERTLDEIFKRAVENREPYWR